MAVTVKPRLYRWANKLYCMQTYLHRTIAIVKTIILRRVSCLSEDILMKNNALILLPFCHPVRNHLMFWRQLQHHHGYQDKQGRERTAISPLKEISLLQWGIHLKIMYHSEDYVPLPFKHHQHSKHHQSNQIFDHQCVCNQFS